GLLTSKWVVGADSLLCRQAAGDAGFRPWPETGTAMTCLSASGCGPRNHLLADSLLISQEAVASCATSDLGAPLDGGRGLRHIPSPSREQHADAGLRPQRDVRRGRDPLTGDQREPEALGDGGKEQDRFHLGEAVADALARPAAKREVGKARQPLGEIPGP